MPGTHRHTLVGSNSDHTAVPAAVTQLGTSTGSVRSLGSVVVWVQLGTARATRTTKAVGR